MRQLIKQHYKYNDKSEVRVTILSDTHARLDDSIVESIKGSDIVIHAGDICNGAILDRIAGHVREVVAVRGNNDLMAVWPHEQHSILNALPDVAIVALPGGQVAVEHGHRFGNRPDHQALRYTYQNSRLVVYGHTHKIICDQERTPWVVNPGAAGLERNHGGPTCLTLDAKETEWALIMGRCDGIKRVLVA